MNRILAGACALLFVAAAGIAGARPVPVEQTANPRRPHASPSPYPSPSAPQTLTPDLIFHNAQAQLRQNPDPPYITYQMHEVFVHHGRTFEYDYRVWYRKDGKALMQNLSRDRRGRAETFWGYPFPASPDANILLYATPPPSPSPAPPPVGGSPLPGTPPPLLSVQPIESDRYYVISLVGVEVYVGRPVFHLALRALSDEQKHPWKDLWIDAIDFEVWKAHANASGIRGPAAGTVDADVVFAPVGPYWLIDHASGDGQVHLAFISDSAHYEYQFSNFGFPSSIPDCYFDENWFKRARGRC